jgi:putative spermidine/putrescine transport system permease protein
MATPFVFITVSAALSNVDPRLEMAARGLGAGALRTMAWVLAPIVAPGLLSGALFAFVQSFDELVVVLFITTRGLDTLPKKMWMSLQDDLTPVIACVSVALGALTLALLLLEFALRARGDRIVRAA